jgi:hypothetical protein
VHELWVLVVAGSNPASPTSFLTENGYAVTVLSIGAAGLIVGRWTRPADLSLPALPLP